MTVDNYKPKRVLEVEEPRSFLGFDRELA